MKRDAPSEPVFFAGTRHIGAGLRLPSEQSGPGRETVGLEKEATSLDRLRAGDKKAFAALVSQHSSPLLRLAMTFVRDRSIAEEVVQETWLSALTGLSSFEGRSSVRSWLFAILVNKARTRSVKEARTTPFSALARREVEEGGSPDLERFDGTGSWREPPAPWTEEDPERLAMGAETQAVIEAAVQALPPAQRAVVTLRDIEGMESDEICNVLGITVTNQRVLLHRARAKVRQALEDRLGGGA